LAATHLLRLLLQQPHSKVHSNRVVWLNKLHHYLLLHNAQKNLLQQAHLWVLDQDQKHLVSNQAQPLKGDSQQRTLFNH
jgi:hypothetical protein